MPHRPDRLHRCLLIAMLRVVKAPRLMLGIAAFTLIGCGVYAGLKLGISTDQDELFSSKVAFFRDYINFNKDFPENQANFVMIEAKDAKNPPPTARWTEAADGVAAALEKQSRWVRSVQAHVPLKQLGSQGLLFDDPALVKAHFANITHLATIWQKSNFLTRTLGSTPMVRFLNGVDTQTPNAETADFVKLLADGWTQMLEHQEVPVEVGRQVPDLTALGVQSPRDLGYTYIPDETDPSRNMLLVSVFEKDDYSARGAMANAIDGIRDTVNTTAKQFPEFTFGLSGRPTLEADEMKTTESDGRWSEIAALSAVFVGLVLLLRSIWLAIAAEIALVVGIVWTFGWATVAVGKLNVLSTVFLIALTGIGMDYLIQILTRYRRESARRSDPRAIWTGVFKYVAAPINTACLGAAGAFFVAVFTNFRGAAELGVIAGGGLLLCLIAGYVILPPLLTLFPAKPRLRDAERDDESALAALGNNLATGPEKRRHILLVLPVLWAVLLLIGIPFARKAVFNPSLLQLQAADLPSVKLVRKLPTWSAVVLSRDLEQLRAARSAVASLPVVKDTDSLLIAYDNYDWLHANESQVPVITDIGYEPIAPHDLPALRDAAHKTAGHFRAGFKPTAEALDRFDLLLGRTPPATASARLSAWQSAFIGQLKSLLAPFRPAPLNPAALPASIREHYVGVDGQMALYINPKKDLWVQANLAQFTTDVEHAIATLGSAAPAVTGIAVNVYHSTSSIEVSFHRATLYALALIFTLVLIDLRNIPQTLLAISVLAMGLPMLVALMGLLGINWNFANFFGLPILIGAGHEYGVFMVHRYNEACHDKHRPWRRWDVSDKALLSCAYVTSVSFGFFWLLGHHQGLKSLGLVMALGTACIYLATLCVLRPLLLWKLGKRATTLNPTPIESE
jgi:predicted RND superfamily exporter protein